MEEKVFISINNWFREDAPDVEPFVTWMKDSRYDFASTYLNSKKWVEENGLIVCVALVDCSLEYNIIAPKSWVDKNIPQIYNYPKFIMKPNENGNVFGRHCTDFVSVDSDPGIYFWIDEEECFEKLERDSLFKE